LSLVILEIITSHRGDPLCSWVGGGQFNQTRGGEGAAAGQTGSKIKCRSSL
jgi:hypothetical protein